ncbi:hypothetical protein BC828DRAFT_382443 [Blastocladiella britannica]|nr:hypothetical protein BC828DRAFT_382443 [Blastocladiella britannica]
MAASSSDMHAVSAAVRSLNYSVDALLRVAASPTAATAGGAATAGSPSTSTTPSSSRNSAAYTRSGPPSSLPLDWLHGDDLAPGSPTSTTSASAGSPSSVTGAVTRADPRTPASAQRNPPPAFSEFSALQSSLSFNGSPPRPPAPPAWTESTQMLRASARALVAANCDANSAELDPIVAHLLEQLATTTTALREAIEVETSASVSKCAELADNQIALMTAAFALLGRLRCMGANRWRLAPPSAMDSTAPTAGGNKGKASVLEEMDSGVEDVHRRSSGATMTSESAASPALLSNRRRLSTDGGLLVRTSGAPPQTPLRLRMPTHSPAPTSLATTRPATATIDPLVSSSSPWESNSGTTSKMLATYDAPRARSTSSRKSTTAATQREMSPSFDPAWPETELSPVSELSLPADPNSPLTSYRRQQQQQLSARERAPEMLDAVVPPTSVAAFMSPLLPLSTSIHVPTWHDTATPRRTVPAFSQSTAPLPAAGPAASAIRPRHWANAQESVPPSPSRPHHRPASTAPQTSSSNSDRRMSSSPVHMYRGSPTVPRPASAFPGQTSSARTRTLTSPHSYLERSESLAGPMAAPNVRDWAAGLQKTSSTHSLDQFSPYRSFTAVPKYREGNGRS